MGICLDKKKPEVDDVVSIKPPIIIITPQSPLKFNREHHFKPICILRRI